MPPGQSAENRSLPIRKKAKARHDRAQETEAVGRFDILLEESQKFCKAVGLHKDLILAIARTDSDWPFILKIDALLETASKEIIRHGLRLKILNRVISNGVLGEFVDSLPMNGRISLLKLGSSRMPSRGAGFYRGYSSGEERVRPQYKICRR